jgi:L-2,4-diaminobutyrate decarboxylase
MPVLLHGEHAHYAVRRAAGTMGLGTNNCITIASTPEFKMDPRALAVELERLRVEKRPVLAVVATAGCTAVGAFDDLEAIAELCERYGVWLHVDGAHGASALLSEKHRWRCKGIESANSVAWDPHKMMLMPLSAGMVLVREGKDMERAFAQSAPYLFHGAESDVELSADLGKRSFQCSRRADVMKVWVALQRIGADGIGQLYDTLCDSAVQLKAELAPTAGLAALHEPESNILVWPSPEPSDAAIAEIRRRLDESRGGWITATKLHGVSCLRVTLMNPRSTDAQLSQLAQSLKPVLRC